MPEDFQYKQETHELIGCAMEVHRHLGHGLQEKPYENALIIELGLHNITWQQQPSFDIEYKGQKVGQYIPDLIAFGKIVIDTKTIPNITDREVGQMLTYLRVTQLPVGLIINFANQSLEWRRIVLSETKKIPSSHPVAIQ